MMMMMIYIYPKTYLSKYMLSVQLCLVRTSVFVTHIRMCWFYICSVSVIYKYVCYVRAKCLLCRYKCVHYVKVCLLCECKCVCYMQAFLFKGLFAQSAGAVEYTNCFYAEE